MKFSLALTTLLPSLALAHFQLNYPTAMTDSDDGEASGPCGGVEVPNPLTASDNSTSLTVDSFALALRTSHPQSNWLLRASVTGINNMTNILPLVTQTSIGAVCLTSLRVPAEYAGQTGIIQVIGDAPDGFLYQCAIVKFVQGSNTTVGPTCTNATGVTITVTNQQNFTNASATGTVTGSAAPSATSGGAAPATLLQQSGFLGAAFAVIGAVFML